MLDYDDDLFPDIDKGPSIVKSRSNSFESGLREAWRLWVNKTERPVSRKPPERFRNTYIDQRQNHVPHEFLMRTVAGAAHLKPHGRDPYDIARAISAMKNKGTQRVALDLLDRGDADIYTWHWEEDGENLSHVQDIEEHMGTERAMWTPREYESAGLIMETLDPERLAFAAQRVKLSMGTNEIMPSDILRKSSVWRDPSQKVSVEVNAKRDSYSAGTAESNDLDDLDIDLDTFSEKLLMKGAPSNVVSKYHLDVPDGYWESVAEYIDENTDDTMDDAYANLEEQYSWHPKSRKEPTW